MQYDVIVIGGGAAGLTAALSASGQGARVLLLEAAPRVGRKILASGNGRCNLANLGLPSYSGQGEFAMQVLAQRPVRQVLDFFQGLGLVTVEEDGGRVYPGCGQAAAVLDVLRAEIDRRKINVICESPVQRIEKKRGGLRVMAGRQAYEVPCVIAACGGMAGGKLGHDGSGYRLLTDLGHTLIPPRPALSPLTAEKNAVRGLSGLRLPAILTLCRRQTGKPVALPCQGEVLFTDYGVSGVCAMELARAAGEEQRQTGQWPILYLDFSPMLGLCPRSFGWRPAGESDPGRHMAQVQALLAKRRHMLPMEALLQGLAPRVLNEKLRGKSLPELARSLAAYPVPLTGIRGFEYAQVTAGGIACGEFDGRALQSRLVPGLYAAGEVLDVDGACGGFNLQFAFASGLIAGEHAGKAARHP